MNYRDNKIDNRIFKYFGHTVFLNPVVIIKLIIFSELGKIYSS